MQGPRRQAGGIYNVMFILGVIGLATMVGLKVLPIYLNQMKVKSAVAQITDSPQYTTASVLDIRRDLQKRWDVEDIREIKVKDIKILKVANGRALKYDYEVRTNLFSNWDIVIWFKDQREITGRGN